MKRFQWILNKNAQLSGGECGKISKAMQQSVSDE
jgi:hypothetical protein